MDFLTLPEFDAEIAKLIKKYRSLEDDYEPIIYRIPNLGVETEIYKVKHFRCKAL